MPKVNAEIRRLLEKKDAGIMSGAEAMRGILEELRQQVQGELGRAALGSWDSYSLKKRLNAIERMIADSSLKTKTEISGLVEGAWQEGQELVAKTLSASGIHMGFGISRSSVEQLASKEFAIHITQALYGDGWSKIKSELILGVLGGKTPQEVSTAIGRNMKDPSIFSTLDARAEAITKTEMGRAFSMASQSRLEEASQNVDGLEKEWRHSGHPKVARPHHLALDGVHIPVEEPFLVGNTAMMYPRDPKAGINEVINCGCESVPFHASWD